jgi:hypothetical protein
MTKASIVQKLLEAGHITAEEAVILLTNENHNGITYIPYNPYYPNSPDWTYDPNRPGQPYWYVTSTSTTPPVADNAWDYPDTKFTPPKDN